MPNHPNLFTEEFDYDPDDPDGYRCGTVDVGRLAGGQANNVKLFEIPPGQSLCPYHYEYEEEWLFVLEGSLTLRTPAGEQPLARGAVVCFPSGPGGAHKVTAGAEAARIVMFSSSREPSVAVYPDSDKIGVWPGGDGSDNLLIHRPAGPAGYYDGEV